MMSSFVDCDVLCVGQATYDLIFSVPHHPSANEKIFANQVLGCGGGPSANAAVQLAKLGFNSAFAGYLGTDQHGELHYRELQAYGVNTQLIQRGDAPTALSAVFVKPNGDRALINYKGANQPLTSDCIDFSQVQAKVMLFDGHEPDISVSLVKQAKTRGIPTVLDAGSVHRGTLALMSEVDYLVCSEKFAIQYAETEQRALAQLAELARNVVITLGERGVLWRCGQVQGTIPACAIAVVDTTGAGDAFHGAFAGALVLNLPWHECLTYASAAGALTCTQLGARLSLPDKTAHYALWQSAFCHA